MISIGALLAQTMSPTIREPRRIRTTSTGQWPAQVAACSRARNFENELKFGIARGTCYLDVLSGATRQQARAIQAEGVGGPALGLIEPQLRGPIGGEPSSVNGCDVRP